MFLRQLYIVMHPLCNGKYPSAARLLILNSLFDYIKGSTGVVNRQSYLFLSIGFYVSIYFTQGHTLRMIIKGCDKISELRRY